MFGVKSKWLKSILCSKQSHVIFYNDPKFELVAAPVGFYEIGVKISN